jgi:hypothetical protein
VNVWSVSGVIVAGIGAYCLLLLVLARWGHARRMRRRDQRRHAEQLEWRRRQALPARHETLYRPGELVDEDAARMAELGYYVADEVWYEDGSRRLVYRMPGAPAL